jgi:hypothetical protein
MELIIAIGIVSAIAAGLACWIAHPIAKHLNLSYVPRYGTGIIIGLVAFAFPLFAALPIEMAVLLYGMACLIFIGGEGIGTWAAHQNAPDPRPSSVTAEGDQLLRDALNEELSK